MGNGQNNRIVPSVTHRSTELKPIFFLDFMTIRPRIKSIHIESELN